MNNLPNLKAFNELLTIIIKNIYFQEDDFKLKDEQDFSLVLKQRIIEKLDKEKSSELLVEPFREWIDTKTEKIIPTAALDNLVIETVQDTYNKFLDCLKKEIIIPIEIIEAWQEAKAEYEKGKDWKKLKQIPATCPDLFCNKNIVEIATAPPILSCNEAISKAIAKEWPREQSDGTPYYEYKGKKDKNTINHYISTTKSPPSLDKNEDSILIKPIEDALEILEKFDFEAAKLHLIFSAYIMNTDKPWQEIIKLSGNQILKEMGWDNKKMTKAEKLNKLAHYAWLLNSIVTQGKWSIGLGNNEVQMAWEISRLWDLSIRFYGQQALEAMYDTELKIFRQGITDPDEIVIKLRAGLWADSFLNRAGQTAKEAFHWYGYLAKETVKINAHQNELALRLALALTLESRIHKGGNYRVHTLLEKTQPKYIVDDALNDSRKSYDLKTKWNNALTLLHTLGWQIIFDEDTYPEWLRPEWAQPENYKGESITNIVTALLENYVNKNSNE